MSELDGFSLKRSHIIEGAVTPLDICVIIILFVYIVQLKERYLHLKELGLGKEKLQLYKLLIFGPPGVGKSSLFEVLLGKNRNTTRNSTGVLNVVQVQVKIEVNKPLDYLSPSKLTPSLQSPSFWHEVDRKQQKARLHTIIKRKVKSSTVLLRSNSLSTEEDQCKKLSSVEQSILEEKYKTQQFSKTMLICYDSGGHLEFFDVMPALTTLPTGNIMVFNMEKGLGDCEVGGYHINGKKYTSQGNANLKFDCTKLLQTAIANIQSLSKRRSASSSKMIPHNLLVVGTHLDKCGTDTEKHETVKKLDKIIYEQILAENTSMVKTRKPGEVSQYLHPISNTEDTLSRHKIAQEIRTAIEEMSQDETDYSEIEVEWLLFQLEIQETKKDYIGQSEYMNIAQNCNMNKSDARNALKFFHEVGIFFYYEKVVDVVFCNPQWLFDRLTNLIVQKYDPLNYSIENNIKKGKFSREDIDSIYAKMIDPTGPLKLEDILNIFVDHNIMACLPNKSEYFMPALLSPSPPNAFLLKPCDEKVGSTLYIEFENTFVPRGVFCCLVVNLAKEGWVINENKAYKDIVIFQIVKNQQAVFMDKIKYICLEIYVKKGEQIPGKKDSYDVCKLFKLKLLDICAQMKIDCTCKVGFSCTNPECSKVVCFPDTQFPFSVESKCKCCCEINTLDYDQLVWLLPSYLTDQLKQQVIKMSYFHYVYEYI